MPVRIFTIPFDEETQTFHDDLVAQFCLNKRVHRIDTRFFTRNHQPFWSVAIQYGQIFGEEKDMRSNGGPSLESQLDEQQKVLLLRMKEWRLGAAQAFGYPVYLIASNAHLISMIQNKCITLESLKLVKGFGRKKIEKYGKDLIALIKQFYQPS
jgi:superfamily II DNA helicase RecQ